MGRRFARCVVGLILATILPSAAQADVIYEEINASRFFNDGTSPEVVGAGFDQIRGFITGGDEGDLFRVYFPSDGLLDLRARVTSGGILPTLLLFDGEGRGTFARASSLNAVRLGVTITAGRYYIGFGDYPLRAIDTDGKDNAPAGLALLCFGLLGSGVRLRRRRTRGEGPRYR